MKMLFIPTMGFWHKYIQPLRQLGYKDVYAALDDKIITQEECRFIVNRGCSDLPSEDSMRKLIDEGFERIPQ